MNKHIKVAVSGAAGQIGYAFLFRLASGQAFGTDVTLDLHLLEIEAALPALQGIVMELEDCAFPLLRRIVMTADVNQAFQSIQWAVLIGSAPRKAGMERSDLLKINGNIFTQQGKAINAHAAEDVRVLIVGNPCNTNALVAMHNAPDVPRERFYAMTRLDQNRAMTQLAIKAGVPVQEVKNMIVWGNHSSTQYPDFYHAMIQGKPAPEMIKDTPWLTNEFIPLIQRRGATVIQARGASSAASAANAALDSLHSLVHDTLQGESYSVASCSKGQYDVDPGLIFSYPSRTQQEHLTVVEGIQHGDFAQQRLKITLDELRDEYNAVKSLGLIGRD